MIVDGAHSGPYGGAGHVLGSKKNRSFQVKMGSAAKF